MRLILFLSVSYSDDSKKGESPYTIVAASPKDTDSLISIRSPEKKVSTQLQNFRSRITGV